MEIAFSSVNPYESLAVITADDPQALVIALTKITTPIKIVAIVPYGNKQAAYIMGDIRIKKSKLKGLSNGNSNSSST